MWLSLPLFQAPHLGTSSSLLDDFTLSLIVPPSCLGVLLFIHPYKGLAVTPGLVFHPKLPFSIIMFLVKHYKSCFLPLKYWLRFSLTHTNASHGKIFLFFFFCQYMIPTYRNLGRVTIFSFKGLGVCVCLILLQLVAISLCSFSTVKDTFFMDFFLL